MEYLLKVSAVVVIFYLSYKAFLQRHTFFKQNRWFLLLGLITSFTIPFFVIPIYIEYTPVAVPNFMYSDVPLVMETTEEPFNFLDYLPAIYAFGVLCLSIRFIIQLASLGVIIFKNRSKKQGAFTFVETNKNTSPFSFFNWIVYNPNNFTKTELEQIITHEKAHAHQHHSVDILLTQLATIMLWFNPFIWLYNKALKQNLEFIADQETQKQFNCNKSYQTTLLKSSVPSHQMALSNHFYNSLIKKRIVMLHKSKSKKINLIKYAFVIPLLAIFLMSFNTEEIYVEKTATIEPFKIEDTYSKYGSDLFFDIDKNNLQIGEPKTEALPKAHKKKLSNISKIKTNQEKTKITITKETSDVDLDKIKASLKEKGITAKFKSVKRNKEGQITSIKIAISSEKANSNYSVDSDNVIKPVIILIDSNGSSISMSSGNAKYVDDKDNAFVFIDKKPNGRSYAAINSTKSFSKEEEEEEEEDNVLIVRNSSDSLKSKPLKIAIGRKTGKQFNDSIDFSNIKVISYADSLSASKDVLKPKNIFFISDDELESILSNDNITVIKESAGHTKTIKRKDPLVLVLLDGKKITKEELNNINPDQIESVSVLKDKNATDVYGEKGKNGVVIFEKIKDSNIEIDIDSNGKKPLYIVNEKEVEKRDFKNLDSDDIESINVLKGDSAIKKYGDKAKDGVIEITTKKK